MLLHAAILSVSLGGQSPSLFETDVRLRVVNDDLLYVVVQINNNSGRTVAELEGFLTELDPSSRIVSERELVHLHTYEPPLGNGQTVVRGVTYPFVRTKGYRYRYHVSRLKFKNDSRIFIYSPTTGLIRIE
ncbi:MAG: hypothetical protein V3U24_09265 [Candidatus Neomarinimicrobiota bacterium]